MVFREEGNSWVMGERGNKGRGQLETAIFVSGVGVSSIGDFIYLVGINIVVLDKTHSAAAVAGLWVVSRFAALLAGPFAGSVSDRLPRRKQLIMLEIMRALLVGLLPVCSQIDLVYAVLFLLGVCNTLFGSVFLPYQTMLIPQERRKRVNSLTSMFRYSAFLVGPAIAGALLQRGHASLPLWLDAASFLVSGLTFFLLPEFPVPTAQSDRKNPWRLVRTDWRETLQFLQSDALFAVLLGLTAVISTLALTADSQEVVFARQALHLGQFGYGMMVVAAGSGFVAGSLLLSVLAKRLSTSLLLGVGMLCEAIGYVTYAFAHSFWWAVGGLVVLGLFGSAANLGFTTYRQHAVPISHMGRLNNVTGPPQQVLNILFILGGGVLANWYGVRTLMLSMTIPMCAAGLVLAGIVSAPRCRAKLSAVDAAAVDG
ncbi:MAG: MFS transporter [Bacilli bacterium]